MGWSQGLASKERTSSQEHALNFEEMVIEVRTLEAVFGKKAPWQSHVQQGRNAESILQALVEWKSWRE